MTDWHRLVGTPLAPAVGPFPLRPFLEASARYGPGEALVVADGENAMAVVVIDGVVRFVGEHHLTDYHSPLGTDTDALVASLIADLGALPFSLDSLPQEAADPLSVAFGAVGRSVERLNDDSCRVIDLSEADGDDWESLLRSKHRHEVRRKRRRYEEARGAPEFGSGSDHFDSFVALHRASPGDKASFMTDAVESFFAELLLLPGARLDVLLADGEVDAAAFGFEDSDGYYLYNSAYEVDVADLSPGIILIDHLIGRTRSRGLDRFDFLKGGEIYKQRLGARQRPLVRLEVAA
jgi:CelD/BcsL family acetyltransferase involved in cellulose biosynthesis